ncbi:MAG: hypothetical protein K1X48_00630 [Burkholderiaceae bacterium]|nr:hypothetical protein [Burkholderiaceae bacterium]
MNKLKPYFLGIVLALLILATLGWSLFFQLQAVKLAKPSEVLTEQSPLFKNPAPLKQASKNDFNSPEFLKPQIRKGRRDIKAPSLPKENLSELIASWRNQPSLQIPAPLLAQVAYVITVCERYSPQNLAPQEAKEVQRRKVVSAEGPMPSDLSPICKDLSPDLIAQAEDRLKEAARAGEETAMRQFISIDSLAVLRDVEALRDPVNAKTIASIQEEQFKYAKILADSGDIWMLGWVSMLYEHGVGTQENVMAAYAYQYAATRTLVYEEFFRINSFSPEPMLTALGSRLDYPSLVSAQQEGERLFRECCSVPAK